MAQERFCAGDLSARVYTCNTAVVGTGAAGYNAADRLWQLGQRDILIAVSYTHLDVYKRQTFE